jgi:hypothetical protein
MYTQGTPAFMALEVHDQGSLYIPSEEFAKKHVKPVFGDRASHVGGAHTSADTPKVKLAVIKHNWSHDLESFLWLLLWFILLRLLFGPDDSELKAKCRAWGFGIFDERSEPSSLKRVVFTEKDKMLEGLKERLPLDYRGFAERLEYMRQSLWSSHLHRGPEERTREYHVPFFDRVRYSLQACQVYADAMGPMPFENVDSPPAPNPVPTEFETYPDEPPAGATPSTALPQPHDNTVHLHEGEPDGLPAAKRQRRVKRGTK